ncbi:MAG: hypothetical protein ABIP48_04445 [Planctomycetota bacterium]
MKQAPQESSASAKYRPYVLAGVLGVSLLYFGGEWVVANLLQGPVENARKTQERLKEEIKKRKDGLERAREDAERLARWKTQSLPSDTEVARSLYQAWLLELVEHVKLGNPSVNSGEPLGRQGLYHTISFSVRGRGTLQQLTEFLYLFYQTDLLHQIRSLNIIPLSDADQLDVSISIEAMVLSEAGPEAKKGATAEQRQAAVFDDFRGRAGGQSERLASMTLASYQPPALADYEPIVIRNLFGVGGSPDPTSHAFLTSINSVNGQPEAWFTLRASGETKKLREGDSFEIGQVSGTIVEIEGSDVILESDGERWLLTLGDSLVDACALPPEL